ncbi:MAG: DNA primase [Halobacteriota archaeon]
MEPNRTRTLAIAAALLLVTAVAAPAAMAAPESLSIAVDQQSDTGEALVTVTDNDSAVENATVQVNPDDNYSANESYETDENGEVRLPNPEETVDVELIAEYDGTNVSETVTLVPLNESLDVAVEQDGAQNPTVNVTQYDDPVENATVNVTLDDENASYSGTDGEYETNDHGLVDIPSPEETVDVTVTATSENLTAQTQATLTDLGLQLAAGQGDDGRLSVEVTDDGEFVDTATVSVEATDGNYTYDGGGYTATNGTLSLPAPDENVTVAVVADYDDETANTTVEMVATTDDRPDNFGQTLVTFIDAIKNDHEGPLGQQISAFVHENNPAADKETGPPAHVTDENESTPGQGNGAGPPDHVTQNDTETDDGNETSDEDRRGPPDHAGNDGDDEKKSNNGQGNGNGPPGQ